MLSTRTASTTTTPNSTDFWSSYNFSAKPETCLEIVVEETSIVIVAYSLVLQTDGGILSW
jgi:hypothetical protein